ncbi:MAG: DUF983 domain-containing protein [Reichenbachiella sp.]
MGNNLGQAILQCSCPKCRKGRMFNGIQLKKWFSSEMYDQCPKCNQTFEPEPGFYYGAMIVSYAFSVAITFCCVFILFVFFQDPHLWVYTVVVISAVLFMWPFMFRYSRSIFLHLFGGIPFDANYSDSE